MNEFALNQQQLRALVERIASFTVGIAVANNTGIGTGTLITDGTRRFVLTAEHVIRDANPTTIRFWSKPSASLVDKAAREVSNAELKALTAGEFLPIEAVHVDKGLDLALMMLKPEYELLRASRFYDLSCSRTLGDPSLEGLSLLCFGFPTANARVLGTTLDGGIVNFLGCASHVSDYETDLNSTVWNRLPSSISPEDNFVLRYNGIGEGLNPRGLSGCGVWIAGATKGNAIWAPDPALVGVVHRYVEKLSVLVATNLAAVLRMIDSV
jgi:Trypsin-like peptidase domain